MFKLILFVGLGYWLALSNGAPTQEAAASGGLPSPEVIAQSLVAALPPPELVAARVKDALDAAAAGRQP
ncbi:MAG: hypothetical protein Q8Q28_03360 [Pseudomonadota bacterium]|nr:hypothetical protein [Pseudomonadota bacterium]